MSAVGIFGVIDLASAVSFRSQIVQLQPPRGRSLLDEESFFDAVAVGPWLVDLQAVPKLQAVWRADVRDKALGYTIETALDFDGLRRHLRKFALAEIEGHDKPVLFRYFDARIIRSFLRDGFTPEQRARFLDPIVALEVVTEDGGSCHVFGSETRDTTQLAPAAG